MNALANDLESGFEILWYKIESVLGRGGFGITYLAKDTNLGNLVAIKEYLPHDFASRSGDSTVQPASVEQSEVYEWGLERFMSEAQTLAKFKHPNIVRVLSVFKHNNTGYMVMEYEEGQDLSDIYKSGKKLKQVDLEKIYYPIISGLAAVHKQGFIHRDIKPANIYIRKDGSPVLIDFGAARHAVGNKTQTLTAMLSVGYAPFEQYNDASGRQGPWTDIYAIGASMYQGITGKKPLESTVRGMALLHLDPDPYEPLSLSNIEGYSYDFLRAIDKSLKLKITDRPQNLEEFLAELKGEIKLPELPAKPVANTDFDKTIIKPVNRGFAGHDVKQDQHLAETEISKTEVSETEASKTEVSPTELPETEVDISFTAEDAKQEKTSTFKMGNGIKVIFAMGLLLIVIAATFILWPEKTEEQIRQQEIASLLKEADKFIAQGEYYNDNKASAYERYSKVLMQDPGNLLASKGINNIAQHFLSEAEQFIEYQKLAEAKSSLNIVKIIDPEFAGLLKVEARLIANVKKLQKSKNVFVLLGKAKQALKDKNFYKPEQSSALTYFNKVLNAEPGNTEATQGLATISDHIIIEANKNLQQGKLQQTEKLLLLAEQVNAENEGIGETRKQISLAKKLQSTLQKADSAFTRKQFTKPVNGNAIALYKQALSISAGNQHASKKLDEIATYYSDKIREYIRSGELNLASSNLKIITTHFPDYVEISNLTSELTAKENQQSASKKLAQQKKLAEKKRLDEKKRIAKQKQIEKQRKLAQAKAAIKPLIPLDINQKQDDEQIVQDIMGAFLKNFIKQDITGLKKVAQLNAQTTNLYGSLFKLYKKIDVKVVPGSFNLIKDKNTARVQFQMYNLIENSGRRVETTAAWTVISLSINKKSGYWLKAVVGNG